MAAPELNNKCAGSSFGTFIVLSSDEESDDGHYEDGHPNESSPSPNLLPDPEITFQNGAAGSAGGCDDDLPAVGASAGCQPGTGSHADRLERTSPSAAALSTTPAPFLTDKVTLPVEHVGNASGGSCPQPTSLGRDASRDPRTTADLRQHRSEAAVRDVACKGPQKSARDQRDAPSPAGEASDGVRSDGVHAEPHRSVGRSSLLPKAGKRKSRIEENAEEGDSQRNDAPPSRQANSKRCKRRPVAYANSGHNRRRVQIGARHVTHAAEQQEWRVKRLLGHRQRGESREVLVRWAPTWEPVRNLRQTAALKVYELEHGTIGYTPESL